MAKAPIMTRFQSPALFLLILAILILLAVAPAPAAEPFEVMMDVITHQRCMNCHPAGNRPRQGDEQRLHEFNVQRGPADHGMPGLQCSTCHQPENNAYSGVPGAPHWGLAPVSMAWEGLSRTEIARSMLNPENNGGRTLDEIVDHLTEDALVLWAFDPGVDHEGKQRTVPPVSKADYIAAVKAWADAGAIVPEQ